MAERPLPAAKQRTGEKSRFTARFRRRDWIGVLVLVALAIVGGLIVYSHRWPSGSPADRNQSASGGDPRLGQPTRGDLAGDQAFLGQVTSAWQRGLAQPATGDSQARLESGETLNGPIDVYWAGDTPAGSAAVVLQRATWQTRPVVEIGLVATNPGNNRLGLLAARVDGTVNGTRSSESFAFGSADSTVLTLAESGFHVFSPYPAVNTATSYVDRDWQDLDYVDGVAVFQVSAQGNGRTIVELPHRLDASHQYLGAEGGPVADQPVPCDGWQPSSGAGSPDPRLHWPNLPVTAGPSAASTPDWSKVFDDALHGHDASDPYLQHPANQALPGASDSGESYWQIVHPVSDEITVDLGEELLGATGRLFAVETSPDGQRLIGITYDRTIDPTDPLPVRYVLPEAQGWLLAAYGSVISTPSQSASDLLVVPTNTTTVTVTPHGGQPRTVTLTR